VSTGRTSLELAFIISCILGPLGRARLTTVTAHNAIYVKEKQMDFIELKTKKVVGDELDPDSRGSRRRANVKSKLRWESGSKGGVRNGAKAEEAEETGGVQ
jgi:hypothetical protein